jgi:predicted nucleic acid-binding protein
MKRRIYTDTSAIGGCLDREFRIASVQLFDRFRSGLDAIVLSELTLAELEHAPPGVLEILQQIPRKHVEEVDFSPAAAELAKEYIAAGVIGAAHLADAQHIALATVNRVDALVSWNFKHIVNLDRVRGYNSVNFRLGYILLEIRTPQEVMRYEQTD